MITIRLFWTFLVGYTDYQWSLRRALKTISILLGIHIGVTKYCCFLCLWNNQCRCYCRSLWKATLVLVHKKTGPQEERYWSEQCSGVQCTPLANHGKSWCHLCI